MTTITAETPLVRAPDLLISWTGNQMVMVQLGAAQRTPINPGYLRILEQFTTPLTIQELPALLGVPSDAVDDVLGIARQLVQWRALIPAGARVEERYFDVFSGFTIHQTMLRDGPRIQRYAEAIHRQVNQGDVVIDAGTGTGVLAMLAARAGAARVFAVDRARTRRIAERLFEENGVANIIEFVESDIEDFDPGEPVDVIVSETFGSLAYVEGCVEALASLARRTLGPDGRLIPRSVELFAAPLSDPERWDQLIGSWERPIAGLDFSHLRPTALSYAVSHHAIPMDVVAAQPRSLGSYDLLEDEQPPLEAQVTFEVDTDRTIHAVGLYFTLEMGAGLVLDTGFAAQDTHWHQTWAPLEPIDVAAGSVFGVRTRLSSAEQELRKLNLDLHCGVVTPQGLSPDYRARLFVR